MGRASQFFRLSSVFAIVLVAVAFVALTISSAEPSPGSGYQLQAQLRVRAQGADWPGYLSDAQNRNFNMNERTLSTSMMTRLSLVGAIEIDQARPIQDAVVTSVAAMGNMLYIGSWDGSEYGIDATRHRVVWRDFLGITVPPPGCLPAFAGVSSNAVVADGTLYLGGPDGAVYALDGATGAIRWKSQIAQPPTEMLWSSPTVGEGHVYIGVSSYGDCRLVRGRLVMLDAKNGSVLATHETVGPFGVGGGISNKPTLIPSLGEVIIATGEGLSSAPESSAVVALDWSTLAIKAIWRPPAAEISGGYGFSSSCMAVPDVGGSPGVMCQNTNGFLYAVRVTARGLAPAWKRRLGAGGLSAERGEADVSSGVFNGTLAYFSTSHPVADGASYQSAVYALDPHTGHDVWRRLFNEGYPLAALAGASDILVVGLSFMRPDGGYDGYVDVLSSRSGAVFFRQQLSDGVFGAPSIANGEIYTPTIDGHVYVYGLPTSQVGGEAFTGGRLNAPWRLTQAINPDTQLATDGLRLTVGGPSQQGNRTALVRAVPAGDYALTTRVQLASAALGSQAVLSVNHGPDAYLQVSVSSTDAGLQFAIAGVEPLSVSQSMQPSGSGATLVRQSGAQGLAYLEILVLRDKYFGFASLDGVSWYLIGVASPRFAPDFAAAGAFTPSGGTPSLVTFESCAIQQL